MNIKCDQNKCLQSEKLNYVKQIWFKIKVFLFLFIHLLRSSTQSLVLKTLVGKKIRHKWVEDEATGAFKWYKGK
jgi:hypothetical protein